MDDDAVLDAIAANQDAARGVWEGIDAALDAHPEFIDTVSRHSLWLRRDHLHVFGTRTVQAGAAQVPWEALTRLLAVAATQGIATMLVEHLELDGDVPAALIGVGRAGGWEFHTARGARDFASEEGFTTALDIARVLALAVLRLCR